MTPELAAVIGHVGEAARTLGTDAVLIGGLSTELSRLGNPGLPPVRRTNDADFAIMFPGWDRFRQFKDRLQERGFQPDPHREHRLQKDGAGVDILPYGFSSEREPGVIVWPESDVRMNVTGFEEACATAVETPLPGGGRIKCVTPPGLAILKVAAFLDRLERGDEKYKSDAQDLDYWLRNFGAAQHRNPFLLAELGVEEVEFQESDAGLLGFEVGLVASDSVRALIQRLRGLHFNPYGKFVSAIVPVTAEEPDREKVLRRLNAFCLGLEEGRLLRPESPRVLTATHGAMSGELLGVGGFRNIGSGRPFVEAFVLLENQGSGDTLREAALILDYERCAASPEQPWRVRLEHQDSKEIRLRFYPGNFDNQVHRGVFLLGTVGRAKLKFICDLTLDNLWPSPFWEEAGRRPY